MSLRGRRFTRTMVGCAAVLSTMTGCAHHPLHLGRSVSSSPTAHAALPAISSPLPQPSRLCAPNQVALSYRGGGFGTGLNFGLIVIADVGQVACELPDLTLRVTPLDRAGRVIRTEPGWINLVHATDVMLSARGGPPPGYGQPPPPGDRWGALLLGGAGRDDVKEPNGLCAPIHEVTPFGWRVTGTLNATVLNLDAYLSAHPSRGTSPAVYACANPDLQLINVEVVQQP